MGLIDDARDTFDLDTDSLTHTPELAMGAAPQVLRNDGPPGGGKEPTITDENGRIWTTQDAPSRSESVRNIDDAARESARAAANVATNPFGILPWELKGIMGLVAAALLAYTFGQLFDVQL